MATDCIIENWIKTMWQNHKILVSSVLIILTLWVLAGVCLYISDDDNFMSNLFSAGSAIGTVGAVITTLYLAHTQFNKEKKAILRSDVNTMIGNLEKFFLQMVELEREYGLAIDANSFLENENIDCTHFHNNIYNKELDIAKKFKDEVQNCKNWLAIQTTNDTGINQEIKALEEKLSQLIIDKKMTIETLKNFVLRVRKSLNS
jgi:hypothetical protein